MEDDNITAVFATEKIQVHVINHDTEFRKVFTPEQVSDGKLMEYLKEFNIEE